MKITYYGHSCFGIETGGKHLLFDPFITDNELAKHIDATQISVDYILVSHAHNDHTADVESIARRTGATIISNWELVTYYGHKGLHNGHPMNFGGKWQFDFGTVKMVQAVHTSSFPDGSYGGAAGGFIINLEGKTIYYSGDTGLFTDMKLFGELHKIDLAFLPIGDNFTMDVEQATMASDFIQCNRIIGMHYDTFGFIKINKEEAIEKFRAKGKKLALLQIGETVVI